MTQQDNNLPTVNDNLARSRIRHGPWRFVSGVVPFLALLCLFMACSAVLTLLTWPYATVAQRVTPASSPPVKVPGSTQRMSSLLIPGGKKLVYEQKQGIFLLSTDDAQPQKLSTPSFSYTRGISPVVSRSGDLFYSGDGIWHIHVSTGQAQRVATLADGQVITSLALSDDGYTLAWSSAPSNGQGYIRFYSGPIGRTHLVYQQPANQCPCFRIFSFQPGSVSTLLLTNDRGDHYDVHYGLWSFDLTQGAAARPRPLLNDPSSQVPLGLTPRGEGLLYTPLVGFVTRPALNVPSDISSLGYANGLTLASIDRTHQQLGAQHMILPVQGDQTNPAIYHWITTPRFTPDGHTLVYCSFSSDTRNPFARSYSIYVVSIQGNTVSKPVLLVTSSATYVELGNWLDDHTLTFYADNALYALDIHSGAWALLLQTGMYAHSIAILG